MIFEWDDQGANHVISNTCQTHDCRDKLDELHYFRPEFKCTLFAVPWELTMEMIEWFEANSGWTQLAVHGKAHTSNYECENWTKQECLDVLDMALETSSAFVKGFRAPGWQISDGCYEALLERGFWVADQSYNDHRRPLDLPAYLNVDGKFFIAKPIIDRVPVEAWHGHTWDCSGNGIYETFDKVKDLVKNAESFEFIDEVINA